MKGIYQGVLVIGGGTTAVACTIAIHQHNQPFFFVGVVFGVLCMMVGGVYYLACGGE